MNWNEYFIRMAELVAEKSKDPSTKVGVVVVGPDNEILSTGFNGFPRGVREHAVEECDNCNGNGWTLYEGAMSTRRQSCVKCCLEDAPPGYLAKDEIDPERWERPLKYLFVEHAERNAVHNAARIGVSLKGATMYFNFEPCPCNECAKAIIQSGIKRLVGYNRKFPGKGHQWEESLDVARTMLEEAGVEMVEIDESAHSGT